MPLKSKPVIIIKPDEQYHCAPGFVPYYYPEELKDLGLK